MEDKEIKKTESNNNGEPNSSPLQLRGLYSKVKISVNFTLYACWLKK